MGKHKKYSDDLRIYKTIDNWIQKYKITNYNFKDSKLDLYDRKVVAYKISKFNNNQPIIDTLNEAISKRKDVHGLIIYSDQGFQYTSFEYKSI